MFWGKKVVFKDNNVLLAVLCPECYVPDVRSRLDVLGHLTCLCCGWRYDDRGGGHEADRATPGSSVDDQGPRLIIVGCRGQNWVP